MVRILDYFAKIIKVNGIILPMNFKSRYDFLHHLRHLFAYDFAKSKIEIGRKVLEIGFGEGYGSAYLASERPNSSIIGLDVDNNCALHAQNKYKFENLKYKLYNGKLIPFKDSTFDVVISFQVIEHVKDDYNFLSEIHRVLKPNGLLIITSVNRFHRLRHGHKPWNIEHIREYYPHELFKLIKSNFNHVQLLGIIGKDEVQEIIINKYNQGKQMNLRWLYYTVLRTLSYNIPKVIKRALNLLLNLFKKQTTSGTIKSKSLKLTAPFYEKYSLTDFIIIKNDLLQSQDILCVCKK